MQNGTNQYKAHFEKPRFQAILQDCTSCKIVKKEVSYFYRQFQTHAVKPFVNVQS